MICVSFHIWSSEAVPAEGVWGPGVRFPWTIRLGLSKDNQGRRSWVIHTVEYYLARKRNETPMQTTPWMNLENMMLSGSSQS